MGDKSVVTGSLLGNQKKNRIVQAAIWEPAKLIPKEFAHAVRFFSMVYPKALMHETYYVNAFPGDAMTHPHFLASEGERQLGFIHGGRPCTIGHPSWSDFYLLSMNKRMFLDLLIQLIVCWNPSRTSKRTTNRSMELRFRVHRE